jgi:hypothetical protein
MAVIETIINNAIAVGNLKAAQSEAYGGQAYNSAIGTSSITAGQIESVSVSEPNVYIPNRTDGIDTAVFNSMYGQIIEDLANRYAAYVLEYFPMDPALMQSVESWLVAAIRDGGSGINAAVEAQIWQRDRDRITTEANSAADTAVAGWAARGFPMPPGAAVGAVQDIRVKQSTAIAAVSREAAIKAFEAEIENVRFAITTAVDYRTKALSAAGDYIRAMAVAPNIASDMSTRSADAQARLISAAAGYYGARADVAKIAQDRNIFNMDQQMKAAVVTQDNGIKLAGLRVEAAVAISESLGKQAAAAFNGVNATSQLIESVE